MTEYREARSAGALRRATISALVATMVLLLSVAALMWVSRWLDRFVTHALQTRIHSVAFQSFEVMRTEHIWSSLRSALAALRMIAFVGSRADLRWVPAGDFAVIYELNLYCGDVKAMNQI